MLFEKDGRCFQFCLINLSDTEYNEISKLIKDHGGEISISREPPVITFSNDNVNDNEAKPVFHINYIRECIKQDTLLDLIDFILGPKGFYGCLMSIFVHGTNTGATGQDSGGRCWAACIDLKTKSLAPVVVEHNYAQGDINHNSEEFISSLLEPTVSDSCDSPDFSDSRFWPDDVSSNASTMSYDTNSITETADSNLALQIPEPSRFEELNVDVNLPCLDNVTEECSMRNVTVRKETKGINEAETHTPVLSISVNINETHSQSATEKGTEVCDKEAHVRLPKERKSRNSPTILCDELNNVKILADSRGMAEIIQNLIDFPLTSSDSDETECDENGPFNDSQSGKRKKNGELRKENKLRRDEEVAGPSRATDRSESGENILIIDNDESQIKAQSGPNGTIKTKAADSSTKLTNDLIVISDSDGTTTSEDAGPSTSSRKVQSYKSPSKYLDRDNRRKDVNSKHVVFSRNFLPWEQKEMVKYLIDNECIAEARGNKIWKQFIADGYLTHRTYQSLNNHFRKTILPSIHRFKMNSDHEKQFRKLR